MPNVRASSGMIGTMRGPSSGSRIRFRSIRVKAIVVETGVGRARGELGVERRLGRGQLEPGATTRFGQRAAEGAAALVEVLDLLGVRARGGSTARP